jgi:sortase A
MSVMTRSLWHLTLTRNFRDFQWPLAAVALTAAFFLLDALWIPVKAEVAQFLLEGAWHRTLRGEQGARPWPWADTHPVAVLEAPRLGIRQIVLDGASGRNLAFGPTALDGVSGRDILISGHRDTHFRFLEHLRTGDTLRLTTPRRTLDFRVAFREIVDSRSRELVLERGEQRLSLLTCYPFDAPAAGGPLRYVVTAVGLHSTASVTARWP